MFFKNSPWIDLAFVDDIVDDEPFHTNCAGLLINMFEELQPGHYAEEGASSAALEPFQDLACGC